VGEEVVVPVLLHHLIQPLLLVVMADLAEAVAVVVQGTILVVLELLGKVLLEVLQILAPQITVLVGVVVLQAQVVLGLILLGVTAVQLQVRLVHGLLRLQQA
jgi:hypothetical protein